MDPLSILTGTLTLASVAISAAKQLKELLAASKELESLIDEIERLQSVFQEAQDAFAERNRHGGLPQQTVEAGSKIVSQAQGQLQHLIGLISRCLRYSKNRNGGSKLVYISWIRWKQEIKEVRQNLMSARLSLSSLLGVIVMSDNTRIHLSLDQMMYLNESEALQMTENTRVLQFIAQQVCKVEESNTDPNIKEEVGCGTGVAYEDIPDISIPRHMEGLEVGPMVRKRYPRYRETPCEGWCSCKCHVASRLQTPRRFALIMGNLLITYSGFRIWPQKCTDRACRQQSIPTVNIIYLFPSWLLRRMLYFAASISDIGGPEVTLNMPRTVSPNAALFSYAVQGNVKRIQDLFSRGIASPFDVAANNGRTALHYAAIYNHPALTQFLLDTGANPCIRDADNESTVSLVWTRIFGNLFNQHQEVDKWRCIFDDEEHLESRAFPPLHKIVLKLSTTVTLHQQLELTTSHIDETDADGYTALCWAAARGDDVAVSLLMRYGADPSIPNKRRQTPLHLAAQSHDPRAKKIMRSLISGGAEVDPADDWGRTPLLYAAAEQDFDDPTFLEPMLESGRADLNSQDCRERTPLGYAALMGRSRTVRLLLDSGADPTIPANWGYTPVIEALVANHHDTLEMLLQFHRARKIPPQTRGFKTIRIIGGRTILHLLAEHADTRTLQLFQPYAADFELCMVDAGAKSDDGRTADEVFGARDEFDDAAKMAWKDLVDVVKRFLRSEALADEISDSSSEDVYEDAKDDW